MQKLLVAVIGKSVGLKGECKIRIFSDFIEQFKAKTTFYINSKTLTLEYFNKKSSIVKFEGLDTKEDIELLKNYEIYSSVEDTKNNCVLKDGEFFWFDLISLDVIEDDLKLGKVSDIKRIAGQDYLYVDSDKNLLAKGLAKNFLIPYIDRYVKDTSLEDKFILVSGAYDILESS